MDENIKKNCQDIAASEMLPLIKETFPTNIIAQAKQHHQIENLSAEAVRWEREGGRLDPQKLLTQKQLDLIRQAAKNGRTVAAAAIYFERWKNKFIVNAGTGTWFVKNECLGSYLVDEHCKRFDAVEDVCLIYERAGFQLGEKISEALAADNTAQAKAMQVEQRNLYAEARRLRTKKPRWEVLDFLATSAPGISLPASVFDSDKSLIGTPSGLWNLRSCTFIRIDPYVLKPTTMQTAEGPKEGQPELYIKVLHEVLNGKEDVIVFFKRFFGYSLFRNGREALFLNVIGDAAGGKSLILNVLLDCLGDYACSLPSDILVEPKNANPASPSAHIYFLRQKALGIISELPYGLRPSGPIIKKLASSDIWSCRMPYGGMVNFPNTITVIASTNYPLRIDTDDSGVLRRVLYVRFTERFCDAPDPNNPHEHLIDRQLPEKLKAEYPKIINWILEGALEYDMYGLEIPDSIRAETAQRFKDEDIIGGWEQACIDRVDLEGWEQARDLYNSFKAWHEELYGKAPSHRWFGFRLQRRFEKDDSGRVTIYKGIKLRP